MSTTPARPAQLSIEHYEGTPLRILQYSPVHGGFSSVSDLMKVPRIGPGVIEQNRCVLVCSSPTSPGTRHTHTPSPGARHTAGKCQRETRSSAKAELDFLTSEPSHEENDNDADTDDGENDGDSQLLTDNVLSKKLRSRAQPSVALKDKAKVAALATPSVSCENDCAGPSTSKGSVKCESSRSTGSSCRLSTKSSRSSDELPSTSGASSTSSCGADVKSSSEDEEEEQLSDDGRESASEESSPPEESESSDEPMEEEAAPVMNSTKTLQHKVKMEVEMSESSPPFSIRSRIPVRIFPDTTKSWMKRKSDCRLDMRGLSPGKKPCRSSERYLEPETSYDALRSKTNSQAMQRHRRIPSKSNPPPELANWLKTFQSWSNAERLLALDELIEYCEPTQVRHMMAVIEPQFQRDFISLLPKELALYVLTFLEPKDLLRAAQTCRYWRILAEDNLLWREKCREEGIEETAVFGTKIRRKSCPTSPRSPWKSLYMRQHEIEQNWRTGATRLPKVLKGHDDHVITCLEFSGSRIVSGSDDNTLKVWSAITGKCLRTLVGHTGGVWSSQMCGHIIISGSTDRTLKVWNADTGQCIHTLYGHTSTVRCMHLHENKVVSGSRDATLRLWDIDSGECLHVLMGHVAAVRCVQYDGRRVVSGAYDYMVKIWDPETETCIHTLQGHTNRVYSLQFDGAHIVSGSLDTSIRVWDVETGNCLHTLIGHQSLTSGMELKDNILVSGNADSTVKVWDITTGQCLQTLQGPNKHQSAVTCLQFNKKFVITSSDDGTVKIWDLKTGDFLRNLVELDSGGSGGVVWRVKSNNTKLVCAVGSRNGTEETKLLVLDFDIDESKKSIT